MMIAISSVGGGESFYLNGVAFATIKGESAHFAARRPMTTSLTIGMRIRTPTALFPALISLLQKGTWVKADAGAFDRVWPSIPTRDISLSGGISPGDATVVGWENQFFSITSIVWGSSENRGGLRDYIERRLSVLDVLVPSAITHPHFLVFGYMRAPPVEGISAFRRLNIPIIRCPDNPLIGFLNERSHKTIGLALVSALLQKACVWGLPVLQTAACFPSLRRWSHMRRVDLLRNSPDSPCLLPALSRFPVGIDL